MERRIKFSAIPRATIKEEIMPVLIHDPHSETAEYAYASFTSADEDECAVATLTTDEATIHDSLTGAHEVIIDEQGRAVTIQQFVTADDCVRTVGEIEVDEDGTSAILQYVTADSLSSFTVEDLQQGNEQGIEKTVNRSKAFYCPTCGNCYSAAGSLKLHMRACMRHRQQPPVEDRQCRICNKVFNSASYLKEHIMRHTGEGPRRCSRCYRKFVDEEKYQAHVETHKTQDKLDAEAELFAAKHGGKKVVLKEYNCSFCSQNFTVAFENGQIKRRYACDQCREKYSNAEMLKRHKMALEDKRDFTCERCGRKFVFEGFLQRHLPTCDGTIKRRRDLK